MLFIRTFANTERCGRGELHQGRTNRISRVWWYASKGKGEQRMYSLNMIKGKRWWVVEIGDETTLSEPPDLHWYQRYLQWLHRRDF